MRALGYFATSFSVIPVITFSSEAKLLLNVTKEST